MDRTEAMKQYARALRAGQRYVNESALHGRYPYPQVLTESCPDFTSAPRVPLGLIDIPSERIIGTTTAGRKSAFAGNFMPLLSGNTEFAAKWVSLCAAHLGEIGIRDPISCFEYMGYFYVTEGNKRVSVLKSYDAATISGVVTRIMPASSQDESVIVYYEFTEFYQLSRTYDICFTHPGGYHALQAWIGFAPDHSWSEEERANFRSIFRSFRENFDHLNRGHLELSAGDALLQWMQVYSYAETEAMSAQELERNLEALWPDFKISAQNEPISLSMEPPEEERGVFQRFFGRFSRLNIAFVHAFPPEKSRWTHAHEVAGMELQQKMGDRVTVRSYLTEPENAVETMEKAVAEGAQVLFATTPPLIAACRQIAARHPGVRVLNCSLSMPYAGVRTYYGRIYEGKFIAGALAGAMAGSERIGYVASYPIIGMPANINAFALGARLTNPQARIVLKWSCLEGDPVSELTKEGVRVISNREVARENRHHAWEWGTYMRGEDEVIPLAYPVWNWGRFYENILESIFSGGWDEPHERWEAVNYWWGMSSGVIDVDISSQLPPGLLQLGKILKAGLIDGSIDPFFCHITDQAGNVRNDGNTLLTPEDLMKMDWLCDNVEGEIPAFDRIAPVSQQLVRLLGIYRDSIPPEYENEGGDR